MKASEILPWTRALATGLIFGALYTTIKQMNPYLSSYSTTDILIVRILLIFAGLLGGILLAGMIKGASGEYYILRYKENDKHMDHNTKQTIGLLLKLFNNNEEKAAEEIDKAFLFMTLVLTGIAALIIYAVRVVYLY